LQLLKFLQQFVRPGFHFIEVVSGQILNTALYLFRVSRAPSVWNAVNATPLRAKPVFERGLFEIAVVKLGVISKVRTTPRSGCFDCCVKEFVAPTP
jgi:hypothetical protein